MLLKSDICPYCGGSALHTRHFTAILGQTQPLCPPFLCTLSCAHTHIKPFPWWPRNCSCDFSHYKTGIGALPWVFYRWAGRGSNPNPLLIKRDCSKPCSRVWPFVITDRVKRVVCALHKNSLSLSLSIHSLPPSPSIIFTVVHVLSV